MKKLNNIELPKDVSIYILCLTQMTEQYDRWHQMETRKTYMIQALKQLYPNVNVAKEFDFSDYDKEIELSKAEYHHYKRRAEEMSNNGELTSIKPFKG